MDIDLVFVPTLLAEIIWCLESSVVDFPSELSLAEAHVLILGFEGTYMDVGLKNKCV